MLENWSSSTVFATGAFLFSAYYLTYYGKKPTLHNKAGTKWSSFIRNNVPALQKVYWSFFFVPGGKFQTIVAALLPVNPYIKFHREVVNTVDGGQFTLAWSNTPEENTSHNLTKKPLVFILPGLVSTSKSSYVRTIAKGLVDNGNSVVVMVNRGLELPCLTGKAFCASSTGDLETAVDLVTSRYPKRDLIFIGISLGGLVMSRYLALKGKASKVKAAFIYSCPFNPVVGSQSIEKWDNWLLYNITLTKDLKRIYQKSKEKFREVVCHEDVMNSRSIRDIDSHFTSKTFGYESVDHYYKDSIITAKLFQSITTPTLALLSNDDSFVPVIPYDDIKQTDHVVLAVTNGGGHVGHLQGFNPFNKPYYCDVMEEFVDAVSNNDL